MVVNKWVTAVARVVGESKEHRTLARDVGFFLSYGVFFILLSVFVPGISMERQIMCWQTAAIAFGSAMYLTWMHFSVHKEELSLV